MNRPILGITMGDPAGCGPEITVRALSDAAVYQRCRPLVIGDIKCIRDALRVTNHSELKLHQVDRPSQGLYEFGTIDVLHLELVDWDRFSYGKVDPMCGNAAFQCVKKVIELAMAGEVDATVTNALNKEAMNLAGHHFNGHMDINKFKELWREMRKELQDNDASAYSEEARKWAVDNGIIRGGNSDEFNGMWEDMMTREQLVTVLYRFAQKFGLS